jgi:hypothetical protein
MDQLHPDFPTLTVGRDENVVQNVSFQARCVEIFEDRSERLHWALIKSLLTQTDKWGLVWRVDFKDTEYKTSDMNINRMVCWIDESTNQIWDLTDFGQNIAPL